MPTASPALQKSDQRAFSFVQTMAPKRNQTVETCRTMIDHTPLFKRIQNLRTHVRAATNSRRVAQHFRSLLNRLDDPFLNGRGACRRWQVFSVTREGARANQRPGPRAKVFRTKAVTHYFLDVLVNVPARDPNQFAVTVFKLENIETRKLQHRAHNVGHLPVTKLPLLAHA